MQQQDIVTEVMQRVDALAAQLGVATDYLWPLMVERTVVGGWVGVGAGIVSIILVGVGVLLLRWGLTTNSDLDEAACATGIVLMVVFALVAGIAIPESLPNLLAPEGETLRRLLP